MAQRGAGRSEPNPTLTLILTKPSKPILTLPTNLSTSPNPNQGRCQAVVRGRRGRCVVVERAALLPAVAAVSQLASRQALRPPGSESERAVSAQCHRAHPHRATSARAVPTWQIVRHRPVDGAQWNVACALTRVTLQDTGECSFY